jgi:vacuolar protein sorting-associated protein 13B
MKKLDEIAPGILGVDSRGQKKKKKWQKGNVYLNEICLNIQPCDLILNCPAIACFLNMFQSTSMTTATSGTSDSSKMPKLSRPETTSQTSQPSQASQSSMLLGYLAVVNLPLVYVNATNLRLFVPRCHAPQTSPSDAEFVLLSDGGSSSIRSGPAPGGDEGDGGGEGGEGDLCLLQVGALALTPHADNPLPRIVVEREMYREAVHAGVTSQIGAQIEDRQYQLDITALSLSTGEWQGWCLVIYNSCLKDYMYHLWTTW